MASAISSTISTSSRLLLFQFLNPKTPTSFPFWHSSLSTRTLSRVGDRSSISLPSQELEEQTRKNKKKKKKMTIKSVVRISDRNLVVKDRTVLANVPDNVIATSGSGPDDGFFIGAVFDVPRSCHVVPLGSLVNVRFVACFRFKLWWMAQRMGDRGGEVPMETQFLLLENDDSSAVGPTYTVLLPLVDGSFCACLQGNPITDDVELCLESGDPDVKASSFTHSLLVHSGSDPFATVTEAVGAVKMHLKTFRHRQEKRLPGVVDLFGWCTWDAFYQEVTQEGVEAGIASLAAGGAPPGFVIIDDGWQSVGGDHREEGEHQSPPLLRLTGIKENAKFQDKDDPKVGIEKIVKIAKEKHGVKYVYVWHAITGYWGGVLPGVEGYNSAMSYPKLTKGVTENEPNWKTDVLALQGLGLVNPKNVYRFYNELHGYLASAGVDGVKVDVQCILETLGAKLGGRVELTSQYHQALDASVARNFPDNGCIACMSHNIDSLYCSKQTAVVRASDDFYPRDPVSHTIHIAAVAYNSVFLGEFMQPDWDMFHSLHPAAEYHASARAISGGPVYVSDAPGKHDFALLRKLVLPDGSILRARLPGRPTQDCLFCDPARDGVSLLKIWNMNKYTGVLGVYNCQGAAWSKTKRKNTFHEMTSETLTGAIRARDVHLISEAIDDPNWTGETVVYCHRSGELIALPHHVSVPVSLKVLEYDVYTVTPIKVLAPGFSFAPFGLIDMFNAGGAIQGLNYEVLAGARLVEVDNEHNAEVGNPGVENLSNELVGRVRMEVKGSGRFGAYCSVKPRRCIVNSSEAGFEYDPRCGLLSFVLDILSEGKLHVLEVHM